MSHQCSWTTVPLQCHRAVVAWVLDLSFKTDFLCRHEAEAGNCDVPFSQRCASSSVPSANPKAAGKPNPFGRPMWPLEEAQLPRLADAVLPDRADNFKRALLWGRGLLSP